LAPTGLRVGHGLSPGNRSIQATGNMGRKGHVGSPAPGAASNLFLINNIVGYRNPNAPNPNVKIFSFYKIGVSAETDGRMDSNQHLDSSYVICLLLHHRIHDNRPVFIYMTGQGNLSEKASCVFNNITGWTFIFDTHAFQRQSRKPVSEYGGTKSR
jgi:hypothetical protein